MTVRSGNFTDQTSIEQHVSPNNNDLISALKESEARLKAIITMAVDGIICIDERGIIRTINPSALELFQYSEEEVIGQNISLLMPEPDQSRHDGYMDNYHRTGERKIIGIGRQVNGLRKDGSTFPFRLSISEVKLDTGTIYTGIVHDMTDQVKAQEELISLNESLEESVKSRTEELEQINSSLQLEIIKREKKELEVRDLLEKEIELGTLKSRFVSMASHEFRTPLTGIQSAASLIDRYAGQGQSENRKKLTDMIRISVRNLTNILDDFLSMDKLHSGKVTIHTSEFDLKELIDEVVSEIEPTISEGQRIEKDYSFKKNLVTLDRNILKNVILNLLSNAIKYSKKDGLVELIIGSKGEELEIAVKDHGIGIPAVDQKHMFERFFRAHNVTNIKGTGLGLNIVKRYLDLLDGDITFKSKEGVGTTFVVTIPISLTQNNEL